MDAFAHRRHNRTATCWAPRPPLAVDLATALQIAARNSREYQKAKEDLYELIQEKTTAIEDLRGELRAMLSGKLKKAVKK